MSSGDTAQATGTQNAADVVRRDGRTDPFFDGAARDVLVIRRCEPCDRWYAPEAGGCPECGAEDLSWAEADGAAVLVSWAVAHSRRGEPAPLALVELAEGPWMYARLRGVTEPRAGLPLRAVFVHPAEGEGYPVFESPSGGSADGRSGRRTGLPVTGADAAFRGPAANGEKTAADDDTAGDGGSPRAGGHTGGAGDRSGDDRDDLRGTR